MQTTSALWKALAARMGASGYTPGTQNLSAYSGGSKVYQTGTGQRIQLFSGTQKVFDSSDQQTVNVYSGDTVVYENAHFDGSAGDVYLEAKAVIDGVEYTDISAPQITRGLMQGGLSVGNAVSATCQFSVRTSDIIAKSAEVVVKMRLTDGVTASEWLTAGTFYISHRTRDPITGVVSLECYDALLKGNAELKQVPWTTSTGEVMTNNTGEWLYFSAGYPRRMDALLDDILLLMGLELDPRTRIETGSIYTVSDPGAGATINTVLGLIAAAHGGNWIITPQGKLRLVPVVSAANAASAANAVDVLGVTGQMAVNDGGTVTGIRYTVDGESRIAGNDTGIVIDAEVSAAVANALLTKLGGATYQSYELNGALYDPAVELGDYVRAGANGEVASALYMESAFLGPAFRGDISAPEAGELADEYPYIGAAQRNYNRALQYADAVAQSAAQSATNALDLALTQQEIFDRLTDGGLEQGLALQAATNPGPSAAGDKKLYLNLDYARFGKLIADFIQGGTLKLGGLDNANGELQIVDASGSVIGSWNKDGITVNAGTILASAIKGGILTLGGTNNVNGVLQIVDASGAVIGAWTKDGITINKGAVTANAIKGGTLTLGGTNNTNGQMAMLDSAGNTYGNWNNDGLYIGNSDDHVKLQAAVSYEGGTPKVAFYAKSLADAGVYTEVFVYDGMLIVRNTQSDMEVRISSGRIVVEGNNHETVILPTGIEIDGNTGASGTFRTADNKTVTVTKGLITGIA